MTIHKSSEKKGSGGDKGSCCCPMCGGAFDKAGKCPKCNATLEKSGKCKADDNNKGSCCG